MKNWLTIKSEYFGSDMDFQLRSFNILSVVCMAGVAARVGIGMITGTRLSQVLCCILVELVIIGLFGYANHGGHLSASRLFLAIFSNVVVFPTVFFMAGGIHSGAPTFLLLGLFMNFMLLKGKTLVVLSCAGAIVCTGLFLYAYSNPMSVSAPAAGWKVTLDITCSMVVVGLLIGIMFYVQIEMFRREWEKNEEQKKELNLAQEEANAANYAKSRFLANMSHEIRTPMHSVIGMTDIMLMEEQSEEMREQLNTIKAAGGALLTLIDDILDFSKIESGEMTLSESPYCAAEIVAQVATILEIKARNKGLELCTQVDESIPKLLLGDKTRMQQILINLSNNAIKFTNEGSVCVRVTWKEIEGEAELTLSVLDTGIGIKDEEQTFVFGEFQRSAVADTKAIEGTGLGLAISKQLAWLMGGDIQLKSTYGEGSEFICIVRQKIIDQTPTGKYTEKPVDEQAYQVSFVAPKAHVLLVDDNSINLKVAYGLLAHYRMKLDMAIGGVDCIRKIMEQRKKNPYDLILMDYMMPDMDGRETLEMLRSIDDSYCRTVPVIALTANAITGVEQELIMAGFQGYISKPIRMDLLAAQVRRLLPASYIQMVQSKTDEGANLVLQRQIQNLEEIKGLDVDGGLRHNNMQCELYLELLHYVMSDWKQLDDEAQKILNGKDMDAWSISTHALKSVANNIGAKKIAVMAERHEQQAQAYNSDWVLSNTPELLGEIRQLINALEGCLGECEGTQGILFWTPTEKNHQVALLLDQVEQYEGFAAMEQLRTVRMANWKPEELNTLSDVAKALEELDYDTAKKLLTHLIKTTL